MERWFRVTNLKPVTNQHFYWMLQLWSGSDLWLGIQLAWGSWHGVKWDAKFFLINVSRMGSIFTFCCTYFIVQYWNYHNPALILSKYPILHLIKSIWTSSTATIHDRFSDVRWWYRNKLHSMDLVAETKKLVAISESSLRSLMYGTCAHCITVCKRCHIKSSIAVCRDRSWALLMKA